MTSKTSSIHRESVKYKHAGVELEGLIAYDSSQKDRRPAVLVCHAWKGLDTYAKRRALQIAKLGYVAFAVDMYGGGVQAKNDEEAGKLMEQVRKDPKVLRGRVQAALRHLRQHRLVEGRRIAAIGYCFGGHVALELARSGADVQGIVSFHGLLDTRAPRDGKIRARILVLHGDADPLVPPAQVAAFHKEMREADCDWQFVSYGGAVHAFTNSEAGSDKSTGLAYNPDAERRSWAAMRSFFLEILD